MKNKNKQILISSILLCTFLVLFGITYSFFNFTDYTNKISMTGGDIYMRMISSNTDITLNKIFPQTREEAILNDNNYIDFEVKGLTDYTRPIFYEIDLMYGDDINGKTRIDDKYLRFELSEISDPLNPIVLFTDIGYNTINEKMIFSDTFNLSTEVTRTYRLRMWFSNDILISDSNPDADFRSSSLNDDVSPNLSKPIYSTVYSSIKVRVYGDLVEKYYSTPKTCFSYSELSNGTLSILGYNPECGGNVIVPAMIDGKVVSTIAIGAFSGRNVLETVELPDSLLSIGNFAFAGCNKLEKINVPSSITTFGQSIFAACYSLKEVDLSEGLTIIPDSAFAGDSSLEIINFPSTLLEIGLSALSGTAIENVVLPDGLTTIGSSAFSNNNKLKTIVIPSSVTTIGSDIVSNDIYLEKIYFNNYLPINSSYFGSFSTPNPIELYIPNDTPAYNSIIPYSTYKIRVNELVEYRERTGETPQVCFQLNSTDNSKIYRFNNFCDDPIVVVPAKLNGVNITSIGSNAFSGIDTVKEISLSNNITSVDVSAFSSIRNLEKFTIPSSLSVLPESMLGNCPKLDNVVIPSTVTSIADNIFYGDIELKNLTLNTTTSNINSEFLSGTDITNLTTVNSNYSVMRLFKNSLVNLTYNATVFISNYNNGDYDGFLENFLKLESVYIGEGLTIITSEAFKGCIKLKSIHLPETLVQIGKSAFYNLDSLESITIPVNTLEFEDEVFGYMPNLKDIYVSWTSFANYKSGNYGGNWMYVANKASINLHVPSGTSNMYRNNLIFQDFNIVEK